MKISPTVKRIALVLMLTWISTGCYVPISQPGTGSRAYIPATRKDFTPGKTSRVEVLLKMGEPDELSPDESSMTYRWVENKGIVTLTGCDATSIVETTSFVFTFDEEGVLKSLDITFDK